MESSVFDYIDYKAFTLDRIAQFPNQGRGIRGKLAESIGCQVAYVSHVLAGDRDFSLEQAEAITRFLGLRADEAEFYILLVESARAGTTELKHYFQKQLDRRLEAYRQLKNRVKTRSSISSEDQAVYYSSWHYQAVRMTLTLPGYRTVPAIAKRLGLPGSRVSEILSFFLVKGLVRETAEGYVTTDRVIHLDGDSPLISKLHSNWRVHTLQVLDRTNPDDYHYSGVVTLSESDFHTIRNILVQALLESHKVIRPSKEERLCVLAMDFYEM